jgi:hypothetical protein
MNVAYRTDQLRVASHLVESTIIIGATAAPIANALFGAYYRCFEIALAPVIACIVRTVDDRTQAQRPRFMQRMS